MCKTITPLKNDFFCKATSQKMYFDVFVKTE